MSMKKLSSLFSFDTRNQSDFVEMTKSINSALDRIRNDSRLKPTIANLAKTADCAPGTLRNRKWPLSELKKIKELRNKVINQSEEETVKPSELTELSRIDRYREQIDMAREETLRWKNKHDDLLTRLRRTDSTNRALGERIAELELNLREARQTRPSGEVLHLLSKSRDVE